MVSLNIRQSCTLSEVLQVVYHQKSAHRAKIAVLTASTWNVSSMMDTEGAIGTVSQQHSNQKRD